MAKPLSCRRSYERELETLEAFRRQEERIPYDPLRGSGGDGAWGGLFDPQPSCAGRRALYFFPWRNHCERIAGWFGAGLFCHGLVDGFYPAVLRRTALLIVSSRQYRGRGAALLVRFGRP